MARTNPRIEQLEFECSALRKELASLRQDPGEMPVHGCGDSLCIVERPHGMHTNGGCRCDEHRLRRALWFWKHRAEYLQTIIQDQRDEVSRLRVQLMDSNDELAKAVASIAKMELEQ